MFRVKNYHPNKNNVNGRPNTAMPEHQRQLDKIVSSKRVHFWLFKTIKYAMQHVYTARNVQVAASLSMCSHHLFQLGDNKSATSCHQA